jgi:hypothetical protein
MSNRPRRQHEQAEWVTKKQHVHPDNNDTPPARPAPLWIPPRMSAPPKKKRKNADTKTPEPSTKPSTQSKPNPTKPKFSKATASNITPTQRATHIKIQKEKLEALPRNVMDEFDSTRKLFLPTVDRDTILHETPRNQSARHYLLLAHVIQHDFVTNKPALFPTVSTHPKKTTVLSRSQIPMTYTEDQIKGIIAALVYLHRYYYFARTLRKPPSPTLENMEVVKKDKRSRQNSNQKVLYCDTCNHCLMEARTVMKGSQPDFSYILTLSFHHGTQCQSKLFALQKVEKYQVNPAVLEAADELSALAHKWWNIHKDNALQDSILKSTDCRFYGLYYLEPACHIDNFDKKLIYESFDSKTYALDEIRAYNVFHALVNPTTQEIQLMKNLIALFIEDIKFIKRIHCHFADQTLYLANLGFLAGGREIQKLHQDVNSLDDTEHLSTTPFSVLIPIGPEGRNIHINTTDQPSDKHHIERGYGLCFDGNIPHAGAISESEDPFDQLALHIHIDRINFCRQPNVLSLVNEN